jgi:class 3 adenylate cyclase
LAYKQEHQARGLSTFQDAREREAALREILAIISRSRDDERPVFVAIMKRASELCQAPLAMMMMCNETRTHLEFSAHLGSRSGFVEMVADNPQPLDARSSQTARAILEKTVVEVEDLADDPICHAGQPHRVHAVEVEGIRTFVAGPLIINDTGIGAIRLYRREVRPFEERQIELVKTFADQAVIAIENVRQLRALEDRTIALDRSKQELESRLEREEATREILQVISNSRDDEKPVFKVILENAARLCDAPNAYLHLCDEERKHLEVAAYAGTRDAFLDFLSEHPLPLDGSISQSARAVLEKAVVHQEDLADDELYRQRQPHRVRAVDDEGMRTLLSVPLISGDEAIGIFSLYRREVRRFDERQIELVQTFAAQAVIAIENVRQFRALQARTREVQALNATLEARVEAQVGEIERMGRLKRFLPPAVAETVVSAGNEKLLSSHRALIATMFCDIRGFTAFCEAAEPEETIEVLKTYHEQMGELLAVHGAGVDHRSGDGIMVIFNDPLPSDDPAGDAVALALAMRDRMAQLSSEWRKLGYRLGFGVGISLGYATVGMVGAAGRYDYTASGTAVNLAARLCDHAADGEILLSPRAFRAVEERVVVEPAGELTLKGISAPVEVTKVLQFTGDEIDTDRA